MMLKLKLQAKSWLIGKDFDAGRDWGQEEKGTTEGEMAGWHQRLDGHEFEWTLGVGDGQGGLACCDSWGRKESDTTEWLNWTELKEGRMPRNRCLWTVVLEKTPENSLDSKEIKPILREIKPEYSTGRTDAEVEAPVFWSSDANRQLTGKFPDSGKIQGQKKKRASEDETAGWLHWCNERELGQTPGDGEGQWGLACCSPWCHRVGHNWVTELNYRWDKRMMKVS